jgi:site-specific DNA recombinase
VSSITWIGFVACSAVNPCGIQVHERFPELFIIENALENCRVVIHSTDDRAHEHSVKDQPEVLDGVLSLGPRHSPLRQRSVRRATTACAVTKPRHKRTYCLSSLVFCGECGRRMSGSWNHGEAYYRCTFPTEYAGAENKHTNTIYLRESDVTPALDGWLLSVFDPKNLDAAVAALSAAQSPDDGALARAEAARKAVADCDARLQKYRSALEAGADPAVVAGWIKEVEGDRLHAERELASIASTVQSLSEAEIRALVTSQRKLLRSLARATPEQRATIYAQTMGPRITYNPGEASVEVEASPACTNSRVGGGVRIHEIGDS